MAERDLMRARPFCDWHEDYGDVLWWRIPVCEPPYLGSPLDMGRELRVEWLVATYRKVHLDDGRSIHIGGWPFTDEDTPHLWWTAIPDGKSIEDQVPL